MLNTLLYILLFLIIILYLFKKNVTVKKIFIPIITAFFLFLSSYQWVFTDEPIGLALRGGREKLDKYTPEWQPYVNYYSIFWGIICFLLGVYFLLQFSRNVTSKKSFRIKKFKNKSVANRKKQKRDSEEKMIPYYPGLYTCLKEHQNDDKVSLKEKNKINGNNEE